jgi:hypothetical protein
VEETGDGDKDSDQNPNPNKGKHFWIHVKSSLSITLSV